LSEIIGYQFESVAPYLSKFKIDEEDKSIVARIRLDESGKPISIVDVLVIPDREKKLFFKEPITDILNDDHLRQVLIYSIYDIAGIPTEEEI